MRKKLIYTALFVIASTSGVVAFDTKTLPDALAAKTREFLGSDTASARGQMTKFSDEDLQRVTNRFKKNHSSDEQRLFWLTEELYRRNAERVAAERIHYLFYAVVAALSILVAFTALTYAKTRKRKP
jgi:hypothetical protein